jgi:hypothetical protein
MRLRRTKETAGKRRREKTVQVMLTTNEDERNK